MSMRRIVTVTKHSSNLGGPSYDVDVDGRELAKLVWEFHDEFGRCLASFRDKVRKDQDSGVGPDETK